MGGTGGDRWGEFTVTHPEGDWVQAMCYDPPVDVALRIEMVGGRLEVVGLHVGPPGSRPAGQMASEVADVLEILGRLGPDGKPRPPVILSAALVRALPIGRLKAAALAHGSGFSAPPVGVPGKGPAPLPASRFEEVAAIYRRHLQEGGSRPVVAVATAYGIGKPGARRYISEARKRGLLGYPTDKGMAGDTASESPYPRRARSRT